MNSLLLWREKALEIIRDLGLLALRLWAGQEFVLAGYTKLAGGLHAPDWFASLHFPLVVRWLAIDVNWVVAGVAEVVFGVALLIGLLSRLAALGLMFITYVAVYTVHFDLGWAGWDQIDTEAGQGFKVPLMLAVMLVAILTQGGGQYALDAWLCRVKRIPTRLMTT
ncbi:MAG: DoxX family protein [Acidobacteriota bacterium]